MIDIYQVQIAEKNFGAARTERKSPPVFPFGRLAPFILVTVLFFLWGIPTNLNDVLIRQFMKPFTILRFESGLVQSAFYMGYFFLAVPPAVLMRRLGYKAGFVNLLVDR